MAFGEIVLPAYSGGVEGDKRIKPSEISFNL